MLALIQRVTRAEVTVEGATVGRIGHGLLALVCAEPGDDDARVVRMAEKLLAYRVFGDENGRMNRSLTDAIDDDAYVARTAERIASMRQLAAEVLARARQSFPDIDGHGLDALVAGHDVEAHPPMLPRHWFAEAAVA